MGHDHIFNNPIPKPIMKIKNYKVQLIKSKIKRKLYGYIHEVFLK